VPTKQNHIKVVAIIIAIILPLAALVLILDRHPDWQQSQWALALGIFSSFTSTIAAYEFIIKRFLRQNETDSKSGQSEIGNGQHLQITGGQQGTITQQDQRGQNVPGPQTNIGSIHGPQFSGPIGTVNLPSVTKSAPLAAPWQIPLPPKDFTGRSEDLGKIQDDLERGATITGLRGMGGIGKTASALVLAQRLKDRFPDGQLFIDLKGISEEPLNPADAMAQVIRAYFGSDAQMPESEAELAGLYRSVLAGKQALLLLDNAASREQVEPLLPPEGCSVLVTSRKKFALPGLKPWDLDPLSPSDARQLLLAIAPRIGSHADKLAKLCAFLPITLKAVAYLLAETTDLTPAKYVEELSDERTRLKQLGRAGEDLDVEACFMLSYRRLPTETARIFRLLSIFPSDFDAQAEEAICQDEGHHHLSKLVRWSLAEYQNPSQEDERRYHLHDLVRLFAAGRLEDAGGESARNYAQQRHAEHFRDVLSSATELYKNDDALSGLRKFDLERMNIESAWAWAKRNLASNSIAASICNAFLNWPYLLELRMHPRERISWLETALTSARQLNRRMEGVHLGNMGNAYADLDEVRKAIDYYEKALAIAREIGDKRSEGTWLGNLGNRSSNLGEVRKAIDYYEKALAISCEIGDKEKEGLWLGSLGNAYADLGEVRKSIDYYEKALAIAREIGDKRSEGVHLGSLGNAYADLGEVRKSIEYYEKALAIAREIGDKRREGFWLGNLGNRSSNLGEVRKSIDYYEKALAIAREIGDKRSEGTWLGNLGNRSSNLGEVRKAIDYYEKALAIARDIGDRRGEGNAQWNMSLALHKLGDIAQAIECAKAALKIKEEIEDPRAENVRRKLQEWEK
jgi:tetratricopeptide (TPR) repeat protein